MTKFKISDIFSPLGIFILYILASAFVIMAFRFIFPGAEIPLTYFSTEWRLIQGFLDFLDLFPALSLSALVIPFGFKIQAREKINPFSPKFFLSLRMSIITAIIAAALYGVLFVLVIPMARNYEASLLSQGRLYKLAKELAQGQAAGGDWHDTAQLLAICERIWPNGPEVEKLKIEVDIRTEEERMKVAYLSETEPSSSPSNAEPLNAVEALSMAETALEEERYFDAHWLASIGGRLAKEGSPEQVTARRLAGRAWSGVNSLTPNASEKKAYAIYKLKRDGHEALIAEEWIRAYYIFLELLELSPEDPDTAKYYAISENGVKRVAFFLDELELTLGRILHGAVFSFPLDLGRLVMRISSLSTFPDSAYGMEAELMAFDRDGLPQWSMNAPYAKVFPLVLDNGTSIAILLRALDRKDKTKQWEPISQPSTDGRAEIILPVSWDDFLLLSNVRRGLSVLSPADLRRATKDLGALGYQPQVFEAELIGLFVRPLFLLPLGIFAIGIGWRYRALKRPRYMAIPMLGILPLVFNGTVHFSRVWFANLIIWAVVSLGFFFAALFFAIGVVILLVFSLILLAAQHG